MVIEERTKQETWTWAGKQTMVTNTKYGWSFVVDGYPWDIPKKYPYHARFISNEYLPKPISKDKRIRNRLYRRILKSRNLTKGLFIGEKYWKPSK